MATEPKQESITNAKITKLDVIQEDLFEDIDHVPKFSLANIERQISTASCHKKRRGLQRRLIQMKNLLDTKRDTRGLVRCKMKIQNDSGDTHCITNNKNMLFKFRNIVPLPISGVAENNTALHATGVGMLVLTSEERR